MKTILTLAALSLGLTAHGEILVTTTYLSGSAEAPPNTSPATGFAVATYDSVAQTLRLETTFSGLLGPTTVAHIHAPTAVPLEGAISPATTTPTFPSFPAGVTSGTYDQTFDLTLASSYNPAFVTASGGTVELAEAALANALITGRAYLNIHTTLFPGGEIRGFFLPDADRDGIPDAEDAFPDSRDVGGQVSIAGCETSVPNVLFEDGSTINDLIDEIAKDARNHGAFVSGVAHLKNQLRKTGILDPGQVAAIQRCAAAKPKH
jgi:hypothetical protein